MKLLFVLLAILAFCDACGFLGGGGGCCGGCGGGCGRRKKRSAEMEDHIKSSDEDMLCNSPELKQVIVNSMQSSAFESSKILQQTLEDFEPNRYVIICSEHPFHYTVRHDTAYCGARNGTHYCQAFII
ncbi:unnamed protein product [Caenorhabditis angaria]|uniref:Ground-like domain-containing protein n=1 Tax=Caenorhabditis angaria TaxID=860376 RepID=A0A9P1N2U5_9PELO|nr:unnamed protein product [Caenorhabditis angaria]